GPHRPLTGSAKKRPVAADLSDPCLAGGSAIRPSSSNKVLGGRTGEAGSFFTLPGNRARGGPASGPSRGCPSPPGRPHPLPPPPPASRAPPVPPARDPHPPRRPLLPAPRPVAPLRAHPQPHPRPRRRVVHHQPAPLRGAGQ